ncbi:MULTISPECIES: RluA family pseudouridine synthase [unclassified Gemella]|uniref:RluA family pseudouridine synthase n=1 Tax=unclassified Gemella TaxID=2624949 RepID=UPI0010738BA6|nr:RluA family pseudouridine synthase [Gemella sp. GL1.1]MBF0746759.1 RluA family pseudouridine synthase [Gemella sp. 19428wG2_WT2a]NYS27281.1 RluA family pseudouridine synthase [Gemella sp. GL1]TFU59484.1 RluA family pseudouridine synthase [Gemella sp. WT2a]
MSNIVLKFKVEEEVLLRDFLFLKKISRSTLTRIKYDEGGLILVDGKEEGVRYNLSPGQEIEVHLPKEKFSPNVRFIEGDLAILYEDQYFMIIDKPWNLATIPTRDKLDSSLLEIVNYYFKKQGYTTIPHVVTRLDRDTSGLVLIAKHRYVHALFEKVDIDKIYLAICSGLTPKELVIEKNIALSPDSIIERVISEDGKYAKTKLTRILYKEVGDYSLIKLKLFTGRTHQIRLHCKSIGHALLGDFLYGIKTELIDRQALHAHKLVFEHPISARKLKIVSKLPEDMKSLVENFKI